ncbi:hypothetical protein [Kibdelosporangium phytohabitans]|uniref:hypothetical protein n=1 Tax=Kibdelosporangium phytohabitans TaxID=860235 RepID=UPI0012FA3B55|nr:hypothetical protein [Kibdelosporangium phytohabitans]MBE1461992.1 hypothetical protein [Kibdelosporangium phytohabitans]
MCYARTFDDLAAMARTAYDNLRPGGEYVGVEMNPRFDWQGPPATEYGLTHRPGARFPGGRELMVTLHVDPPITFRACHWEAEPIVDAFHAAGFTSAGFVPAVGPGGEFWADFRQNPTVTAIRAVKGQR